MLQRRHWLLGAAASTLPCTPSVWAQSPPALDKPVRIVVGFPPGGSADLIARALAPQMGAYASQVIVDNKPGAGGRIALEALKNAEPDGSTLVVTPSSMVSIYPHVYKRLSYDPQADFTPVAMVASFPFVLVVGPMVPERVKSLADFLAWCKAHPSQAAYASPGGGSTPHFAGASLARASGVDLLHVPYKGGAPAMNDVMGGQIAANMAVVSNALPQVQAGKVRAIAVTGTTRSPALPQVPTVAESGFPEVVLTEWFGVYLPRKAPPDVVGRLNKAVLDAVKAKGVQEVLAKAAFEAAAPLSAPEFAQMARADMARWGQVVKASGFTPED